MKMAPNSIAVLVDQKGNDYLVPALRGTNGSWIPAFAGMTILRDS